MTWPPSASRRFFLSAGGGAAGLAFGGLVALPESAAQPQNSCQAGLKASPGMPDPYQGEPGMLALRAEGLLRQASLGFNYFGTPRNWIPTVSVGEFGTRLGSILDVLKTVEASLSALDCTSSQLDVPLDRFEALRSNNDALAQRLTGDLATGNDYVREIQTLISSLADDIDAQYRTIVEVQAHFNDDVQRRAGGGCGFGQVFEIVVAIVAVVAAVYTAGASLSLLATSSVAAASAGAAALGAGTASVVNLKKAYDSYQTIEKNVQKARAEVDDIVAKYEALQRDFDMTLKQDAVRIALDEADYDALTEDRLAKFDAEIDAADASPVAKEALKSAVHKYVALVDVRNRKIFDHDSMVTSLQTAARRLVDLDVGTAQVDTARAAFIERRGLPERDVLVARLRQAQDMQLTVARNLVWDECAAVNLVTMDTSLSGLGGTSALLSFVPSVANLVQIHNGNQERLLSWEVDHGPGTSTQQLLIRRSLSTADRKQLRTSHRVTVVVTEGDLLPSMREVFVTGFRISTLPGSKGLSGSLTHLGIHRFVTQGGRSVVFSSRVLPFGFDEAGGEDGHKPQDLTEGGKFVGFAALGDWLVKFDTTLSAEEIGAMTELQLTFQIRYRAPTD